MMSTEDQPGGSAQIQQNPAKEPVTKADLRELIESFTASVDAKIETVHGELLQLHEAQQKSKESLVEKLKETATKKWKREGNKRQYEFNQQVADKCDLVYYLNFLFKI